MIGSKIWERYLLKETAKVFFLFIGAFYFLYVLIDYSVHARLFGQSHIRFFDIVTYYGYQFSNRADLLLLFALLLASIRVLSALNTHNEAVALLAGGIRAKRIVRPLLVVAFASCALLYANAQWLSPHAIAQLQQYRELNFGDNATGERKKPVNEIVLTDGSKLIYQYYDSERLALLDTFWLKKGGDIYRIKTLFIGKEIPLGERVDHLVRDESHALVKGESFDSHPFHEMSLPKEALSAAALPLKDAAMTAIWQRSRASSGAVLSDEEAEALSTLYYKLAFPLASFLVVIGVAPSCLRFGRNFRSFPLYAVGIFSVVAFSTIMDAAVVLGSTQVLPPLLVVSAPIAVAFALLGWRYIRWN